MSTTEGDQQMVDTPAAQRIHKLIQKYEEEEENFLRDIEAMHQQCANTDTSDETIREEQSEPVLGTLCSLVGEIGQLRRENHQLRRRLTCVHGRPSGVIPHHHNEGFIFRPRSSTSIPKITTTESAGSVLNRVNAFFEKSHRSVPRLLSMASTRLLSSSSSGTFTRHDSGELSGSKLPKLSFKAKQGEGQLGGKNVRTGKQLIDLPSPHQMIHLIGSTYSGDLSSEAHSTLNRNGDHSEGEYGKPSRSNKPSSDCKLYGSEDVSKVPVVSISKEGRLAPHGSVCAERANLEIHRPTPGCRDIPSHHSFLLHARGLSGSNSSSSTERKDQTGNNCRNSFLELIGIKKQWERIPFCGMLDSLELNKKRKRQKDSESDSSFQHSYRRHEKRNKGERHSLIETSAINGALFHENYPRFDVHAYSTDSSACSGPGIADNLGRLRGAELTHRQPQLHYSAIKRRHSKHENGRGRECSSNRGAVRPKSVVYLEPGQIPLSGTLKSKAQSCKTVVGSNKWRTAESWISEGDSEDAGTRAVYEENSALRNEVRSSRARNNRLVDQLRQKSAKISQLETHSMGLEKELDSIRREANFNELLKKDWLREHASKQLTEIREMFLPMETKLGVFEEKIRSLCADIVGIRQAAAKNLRYEQNAYQQCLGELERTRHENIALLQQVPLSALTYCDRLLKEQLEMLPSYDALFSFAIGAIKKLSQLRNLLVHHATEMSSTEVELVHTQILLLLAHMQLVLKLTKLEVGSDAGRLGASIRQDSLQRSHSYHEQSSSMQPVHRPVGHHLPFVSQAKQILERVQHRSLIEADAMVESNEREIEVEFLRLFDYARCISKVCSSNGGSPLSARERKILVSRGPTTGCAAFPPTYSNRGATASPVSVRKRSMGLPQAPRTAIPRAMIPKTTSVSPKSQDRQPKVPLAHESLLSRRPVSWVEQCSVDTTNLYIPVAAAYKDSGPSQGTTSYFHFDGSPSPTSSSPRLNLLKLGNVFRTGSKSKSPSTTPVLVRKIPLIGVASHKSGAMPEEEASYQSSPKLWANNDSTLDAIAEAGHKERTKNCPCNADTLVLGAHRRSMLASPPSPTADQRTTSRSTFYLRKSIRQLGENAESGLESVPLQQIPDRQPSRAGVGQQPQRSLASKLPQLIMQPDAALNEGVRVEKHAGKETSGSRLTSAPSLRRTGAFLRREPPNDKVQMPSGASHPRIRPAYKLSRDQQLPKDETGAIEWLEKRYSQYSNEASTSKNNAGVSEEQGHVMAIGNSKLPKRHTTRDAHTLPVEDLISKQSLVVAVEKNRSTKKPTSSSSWLLRHFRSAGKRRRN